MNVRRPSARPVWPDAWRTRVPEFRVIVALTLGITLLILLVLAFTRPGLRTTMESGLLAVLFAVLSAGVYYAGPAASRRRPGSARTISLRRDAGSATGLTYSVVGKVLWYGAHAVLVAGLLLFPLLISSDRPDQYSDATVQAFARISPFLAVVPAVVLLGRLIRKRGDLGVGLAPAGVYVWGTLGCSFFAWSSIEKITTPTRRGPLSVRLETAEPSHRAKNPEENIIGTFDSYRRSCARLNLGLLSTDPMTAFYALHYYLRHPEARDELGTVRGLQRVQAMDFADVIDDVHNRGDIDPEPLSRPN